MTAINKNQLSIRVSSSGTSLAASVTEVSEAMSRVIGLTFEGEEEVGKLQVALMTVVDSS